MSDPVLTEAMKLEFARIVSKLGDFELAHEELASMSVVLSDSEVIDLYEFIRDNSMRLEEEWRDSFADAFPELEHLLPEPEA